MQHKGGGDNAEKNYQSRRLERWFQSAFDADRFKYKAL